jgi:hypothetical protein
VVARAPRKPAERRFYEQALTEAERANLDEALEVEGFDEEIAALRVRLRSAIKKYPEDLALMLRGIDVLRRLLASKYGLSKEDQRDFKSAFAAETLLRMHERGEGGDSDDAA